MRAVPALIAAALAAALAAYAADAPPADAPAAPNPLTGCACHDSVQPADKAPPVALRAWAKDGPHLKLGCTACHPGADAQPMHGKVTRKDCASCHEKEAAQWKDTVHGKAEGRDPRIKGCLTCHGEHGIIQKGDVTERYANTGLVRSCSSCHKPMVMATDARFVVKARPDGKPWKSSLHGLWVDGDHRGMAACETCHGAHQIFASSDPRSAVNAARLGDTCGQCHEGVQPGQIHGKFKTASGFSGLVTNYFDIWYLWAGGTVALWVAGVVGLLGLAAVLKGRKTDSRSPAGGAKTEAGQARPHH